jgi:hypothetical protein
VVPGSDSHPLMEGIIVDITDRKQLEGQLQQARRMEAVGGWPEVLRTTSTIC